MNRSDTIDFVLPWVDPNDPVWQKERNKYDKDFNREDKNSITRFRDMNTLKYVLRSIEQYCPWYHKIYLITAGHTPDWLDVTHPKIELVTHEELFINKSDLPVFNSNAIEMNLVNIEGLSEKFVYLNDDMVVWNSVEIERFFQKGKPVDFFSHSWIPRNWLFSLLKGKDNWVDAINNNIRLMNKHCPKSKMSIEQLYHSSYGMKQKINNFIYQYIYKKLVWINHWHHPQPYRKSTIDEVYNALHTSMSKTSKHKFRSSEDVTPYLYRYWHLMHGEFSPHAHHDATVVRPSSLKHLQSIIRQLNQDASLCFVCFNDQANEMGDDMFAELADTLSEYLETRFYKRASFELG